MFFILNFLGFDLFHSFPSSEDVPDFIEPIPVSSDLLKDIDRFKEYFSDEAKLWWIQFCDESSQIPLPSLSMPEGLHFFPFILINFLDWIDNFWIHTPFINNSDESVDTNDEHIEIPGAVNVNNDQILDVDYDVCLSIPSFFHSLCTEC